MLETAEHELALFLETGLIAVIGPEAFRRGVEARQARIDEARSTLGELRAQGQLSEELTSGDLLSVWSELTIQEKRTLLHGLLDRVIVKQSDGRRRDALSVRERTQIILRGNVLLEPVASS
jgi:hypothetical protein